jgi:amino acid transporter
MSKTLAANSLSVWESVVMGTAGAAPAFSLSAVSATLFASIGILAPASILYCGFIMFGITLAFMHLNRMVPNSGASYAWVSNIFGSQLGFLVGWALLVSSALFMVSASIPAASATLLLFAPDLVHSTGWVTFVAAIWVSVIAAVTIKGIKPTSYLQLMLTSIEIIILLVIIIATFYYFWSKPAHVFSWSWLSITQFTPSSFATAALSAIFLYWGWDVTLNLNEETKNREHAPGMGALGAMLIITFLFVIFACITLLALSDREIQESGSNVIFAIADKIFPRPWGYLAVLSVMLSTVGTIETTMLQFSRTMFAASRDGALHHRYANLHSSWNTPWIAVIFIWVLGLVLLYLSSNMVSVSTIIKDSINAIGFQVAFYYSLTGLACAWFYRKIWQNTFELIGFVIWPMISAMFLICIACLSIFTFDLLTNIISLGGICLGIVPLLWRGK